MKLDLGPALRASFPDVKLMMMDDQRTHMVNFANVVLSDPEAAQVCVRASLCCELSTVQYISGIAVHWYEDMLESAEVSLGVTHNAFPEKFILSTEGLDRMACGLHVTGASMYWFPSFLPPGSVDWQLGPWCRVCLRHHREPAGVISCFLHAHSHAFRTGRWAGPTGVLSELYVRCI